MVERLLRAAAYVVAVAALWGASLAGAAAQDQFYKGKAVSLVMGTGPGGSYDLYARLLADHFPRFIPGAPPMLIEHMPGAGGVIAANFIYAGAVQDGTKILVTHPLPLIEKLEPNAGVRYESARLQWLGTYDSIAQVMALWHTAPTSTLAGPRTKDLVLGSFNKSHLSYQWARLAKTVLGSDYKVITGYPSGNELNLAMERGEISGWVVAWENLASTKPDWLSSRKVSIPVQFTAERMPDLPNVPTLLELAPAEQKDVVEFIVSGTPFSRGLAVGPKVPADQVRLLRAAFDNMMADPEFLADAKRRKLGIDVKDAIKTQAMVERIVSASPALVERVKRAIGQED